MNTARKSNLSVLIPYFNHGNYLQECLNALLNQTLPPDEIIIADDASTDGSVEILKDFSIRYPQIKLILHKEHKGLIFRIGELPEIAKSEYISFLAAVDICRPRFYEISVAMLERKKQAAFSCGLANIIDIYGNSMGISKMPVVSFRKRHYSPTEVKEILKCYGDFFMSSTIVYRKSLFLEEDGFKPFADLHSLIDNFKLSVLAAQYGCVFIPEPLANWRKTSTTYSAQFTSDYKNLVPVIDRAKILMMNKYSGLFHPDFILDWEREIVSFKFIEQSVALNEQEWQKFIRTLNGNRFIFKSLSRFLMRCCCAANWFFLKLSVFASLERSIFRTLYNKITTRLFICFLHLRKWYL